MGSFRLLLAFTIVLGHIYAVNGILDLNLFHLTGSAIAFQSFFLVTGFTIAMAVEKRYPDVPGSYKLFLSNRILRIFPLYWFFLLLTLVVCIISWKISGKGLMLQPVIDFAPSLDLSVLLYSLFANVFIIGQDLVFFLGIDPESGNFFLSRNILQTNPQAHQLLMVSQAWVISFFIIFYLLAPWLLRKNFWVLLSIFLISQSLRLIFYSQGFFHEPWTYRFLPFEFGLFVLGALSWKLYPFLSKIKWPKGTMAAIFFTFILFAFFYDQIIWWPYWKKQWTFYLLLFLVMPFLFIFSENKKWDKILGDLSLPVYLGHFLVIHLVKTYFNLSPASLTFVTLLFVSLLSLLVYFLFQKKLEEIRKRRYAGAQFPVNE